LDMVPNIKVTGPIPYGQVAALNNTFDVCINPQLINEMTKGNYPRKIDEFLALGKPVVATRTLAMEEFAPVCYLATGFEEFNEQIMLALSEETPEKVTLRKIFAANHSWEASIYQLLQALQTKV
jgi:teichuronic acid biosynthesis glycosyltransferase TuaH